MGVLLPVWCLFSLTMAAPPYAICSKGRMRYRPARHARFVSIGRFAPFDSWCRWDLRVGTPTTTFKSRISERTLFVQPQTASKQSIAVGIHYVLLLKFFCKRNRLDPYGKNLTEIWVFCRWNQSKTYCDKRRNLKPTTTSPKKKSEPIARVTQLQYRFSRRHLPKIDEES